MSPPLRLTRPRLLRVLRTVAIGLAAFAFVLLLPVAPAQNSGGSLGTVRMPQPPAAPLPGGANQVATPQFKPGDLPYRPFLDPVRLPVHTRWYLLLLPMSFGVAVVYKAVMLQTMERYWHQVGYLTAQIIVGMILLAIASYAVVMWYVPWMAER
jgi:hypothetical protein